MDAPRWPDSFGPERYPQFRLRVATPLATPVQPLSSPRAARGAGPRATARKPVPPPWVTVTEAARRLGVSTKTVRRRIADGSLAAHKALGPGGFCYRVTDPSVLVVQAGLDTGLDRAPRRDAQAGQQLGQAVGQTLLELSTRLAAAEVRAARAEWERDALRAQLAALAPAPPPPGVVLPWWRRFWPRALDWAP